ncbi:MAG TPA: hypothetical protein VIH27_04685 [Nitrososphaerales archaeon]
MRRERIVCHNCGNDLEVKWIRAGKMKWVKEGVGSRNGKMLRFFCPKCRRFVKPYPEGQQSRNIYMDLDKTKTQ